MKTSMSSDPRLKEHPCFTSKACHQFGRIHLPVAPKCNIQCNYCDRKYDCVNESRPGVTSTVLTPDQALNRVTTILDRLPLIRVVGIAGPGDPLANPEAVLSTFELVHRKFPRLKLCLSTNGLVLPDYVSDLKAVGVDFVTITINTIDEKIGQEIYHWVRLGEQNYYGEEAARILISRQLEGLSLLRRFDILTKVNTVYIPGVNDRHIPYVADRARNEGVELINIVPLIPVEGTVFGDKERPTREDIDRVRFQCAPDIKQMRHCQQCRADAVGLLTEDRGAEFTDSGDPPIKIAVATTDSLVVDLHFGHAEEFHIYQATPKSYRLVEVRKLERVCGDSQGETEKDDRVRAAIDCLRGCDYVLCRRLGHYPATELSRAGITALMATGEIGDLVQRLARKEVVGISWEEDERDVV